MEKYWKIINISDKDIKVSIRTGITTSLGIILKPRQFCFALNQMTAPLDSQVRKNFLRIDEIEKSKVAFPLGKTYSY